MESFLYKLEKKMTEQWWEDMQKASKNFYLSSFDYQHQQMTNVSKVKLALDDGVITNIEPVELRAYQDDVIGYHVINGGGWFFRNHDVLAILETTNSVGEKVKVNASSGDILEFAAGSLTFSVNL